MRWQVGVDLGGTKISMVLLENNKAVAQQRVATPLDDYSATLQAIANLHSAAEARAEQKLALGLGSPGSISPITGVLRNSNSQCLNGRNLPADLEALIERPVSITNDANCLALSEAADGVASQANSVFAVILGTGVGGGLILNGQLVVGANGIAGEWGHNVLSPPAPRFAQQRCYCGQRGCVETWLSGPALTRHYFALSGSALTAEQIVAAVDHDRNAQQVLEEFHRNLALALASVINVVDPEIIVLGGGLSQIESIYATIGPLLKPLTFTDSFETAIVKARWGDDSGVRGAARLVNQCTAV